MLGRRRFMQQAALGAAVLGLPVAVAKRALAAEPEALPSRDLLATDPERFWAELRRQWLLAADRINLNCGSVGCTPLPVLRATIHHLLGVEAFREPGYPWFGYEENALLRKLRDTLAAYLHCRRDEIALVRNATEGNNIFCNGLDLKPGDEVVLTDQEHAGGRCCWEQKAARFGIKLCFVTLPKPPNAAEEIVELFRKAITPRTRVFAFSHITTVTGLMLPAKAICKLAREHGILSHIDGAHGIGQISLDLHDLGCDSYATSPHKWLLAPKGTGVLYLREEVQERLWAHTVSSEWRNHKQKAYRFSNLGTSNLSVMAGLQAALDFQTKLGANHVYARIHHLARRVHDHLVAYPQLRLANASKDFSYGGLLSFEAAKGNLSRVAEECAARNIRVAGGSGRIRVATHIFTQPTDLNALFDAVDRGLRG
jgi:isopenicillin-N epimerase